MLRLTRLWVDGFHNLKDVTVDFDPSSLTTVILGQNGTGKSYLLEAIVLIFRNADLDVAPPEFQFSLSYEIGNHRVMTRCLLIIPAPTIAWRRISMSTSGATTAN